MLAKEVHGLQDGQEGRVQVVLAQRRDRTVTEGHKSCLKMSNDHGCREGTRCGGGLTPEHQEGLGSRACHRSDTPALILEGRRGVCRKLGNGKGNQYRAREHPDRPERPVKVGSIGRNTLPTPLDGFALWCRQRTAGDTSQPGLAQGHIVSCE